MKAEGLTRREFDQALARSLAAGYDALKRKGGSSVDAVEAAVRTMEDCSLFNAGVGAAFNSDGRVELDAAIMEGKLTGRGEGKEDPRKRAGIEALEAVEALRACGCKPAEYNLAMPFSRPLPRLRHGADEDSARAHR